MQNLGIARMLAAMMLVLATGCAAPPPQATVKVAVVHFGPTLGDVGGNRERLVALTEEAAQQGAKIIVHTEMATSGYAFFSRAEIARVAEPVPGPTTLALAAVAKRHSAYVVIGLPIVDQTTGRYFNAAVLIGPAGKIVGLYKKRNNLLEASYNAEVFEPIPTFDTAYGRLGIVICADLFYSWIPRIAAVEGADILLAPANVGVKIDFLKVRAFENDMSILVANRYGSEGRGAKAVAFDQETFAIPSPFDYDFSWDATSAIVTPEGTVRAEISGAKDAIGYAILPVRHSRSFPIVRHPSLYALMAQDTLETYTFLQFGLPKAGKFAAAAVDPGRAATEDATINALESAVEAARQKNLTLRLAVLPADLFPAEDPGLVRRVAQFAHQHRLDIVLSFARERATSMTPVSLLVTPDSISEPPLTYRRTHKLRSEPISVADRFLVVDRDYGRLALLQGQDLLAPETSVVMAKMGVDVIAVSADFNDPRFGALLTSRTGDYLHIVESNRSGLEGIYLGGYRANPPTSEAEGLVVRELDTTDIRNKKEPRFVDVTPLLNVCSSINC